MQATDVLKDQTVSNGTSLNNSARRRIFNEILHNPGIHLRELQRRADISCNTIIWHIRVLEDCKMIKSKKEGYYKYYYPVNELKKDDPREFISNPTRQKILVHVREIQGSVQKEISEATGVHKSTALHHLRKLKDAGLVHGIKDGKHIRYFAFS